MALRVHGALAAATAALGLCLFSIGCDDAKKPPPPVDAGLPDADTGPIVGGRLGQALASAAQAPAAPPPNSNAGAGGPPESGIFEAAAATAAHAPGAPPKLEIFGEGTEPRASLTYALPAGGERKTSILLSTRVLQQALPPITIELVIKPEKAKGDDKKKADDKSAAPASSLVVAKVGNARGMQGDLTDDLKKKMKDVVIRYRITPNGILSDLATELPKDPGPAIELITGALADAISAMIAPVPDKPMGAGGYWMVTDRTRSSGVDVVRYRVVKVEKTDGKTATLSIEARQYAANPSFSLPIIKEQGLSLERYESQGKGEIDLGGDPFLPARGQIALLAQSLIKGQRMVLQTETKAALGSAP
jgi:hypothetical protein